MRRVRAPFRVLTCVTLLAMLASAGQASAALIYQESSDGDLNNAYHGATDIAPFGFGDQAHNEVTGSSVYSSGSDADYVEFTLEGGETVSAIFVTTDMAARIRLYEYDADINFWFDRGDTTMTASGTEMLDEWGHTELGAGRWAFGLFNATGTSSTMEYTYDIVFVPSPTTVSMALGLAALALVRRRRSH